MAGKFEFLKHARGVATIVAAATDPPADVAPPEREQPKTGRPRKGKSSDPRYRPITVVLQSRTIRLARRKLEDDERDQDLSDLVQELLTEWLGGE